MYFKPFFSLGKGTFKVGASRLPQRAKLRLHQVLRQERQTAPAKSRSVLVGWKDPMIYQLERAAPTPTQEGIMVTLQWLASAKVSGRISDLTNVFGQARKTSHKN